MESLNGKGIIVSISGGNILESLGGTEKVIITHQKMFNDSGMDYLYLYPIKKNIHGISLFSYWGVVYNGKFDDIYTNRQILQLLAGITEKEPILKFHIHHLREINLDYLGEILDTFYDVDVFLYAHDYFLICDSYTLADSQNRYCGEGLPSAMKCGNCSVYLNKKNSSDRRDFVLRYKERVTLITPSDYPKMIIENSWHDWDKGIKVIYHQKKVGVYSGNKAVIPKGNPIKIAFCGLQTQAKGWPDFLDVAKQINESGAFVELYHFGKAKTVYPFIKNVSIGFSKGELPMTEALRKYDIDAVVLWSQTPETYSYVFYECLAANVVVYTCKLSGNICTQVAKYGNGFVLHDKEELYRTLVSESLVDEINNIHANMEDGPQELVENDEVIDISIDHPTANHLKVEKEWVSPLRYMISFLYKIKKKY